MYDTGFRCSGDSNDPLDRYAELYIQTYKSHLKHLPILIATVQNFDMYQSGSTILNKTYTDPACPRDQKHSQWTSGPNI